MVFKKGSQIVL